jgi:magnesium transporter
MGVRNINAVVNCAAYCGGERVATVEIDEINSVLQQGDKFIWIGMHEPDNEMLTEIQREFGLHDLAIEDALRAHQRPKLEAYGDTLFIVMRTVQLKNHDIDLGETHFFMGSNFIITVRHGSSVAYKDVRARCESTPHLLKRGPGFALYAVMDSIVDQYFPVLAALEEKLDGLEQQIFDEKYKRQTTAEIYHLKRQLLEVKRSVSPLIDICNKLMRFDLKLIDEETRAYFRDVYDHTVRINEMVDNARELLSTALEANLSLISISQNEVSKRFAGWAAIIGIPTMVAGIYGMNFKFMPELEWEMGYPVILSFTLGLCVFLYLHFKRSGWL